MGGSSPPSNPGLTILFVKAWSKTLLQPHS
jgi:hypothetical protein